MKRSTQTKIKIKIAFVELIQEKGLEVLTVSDITRRSNINRGTFYLHYVDKYELMEQLENEIIEELKSIVLENKDQYEYSSDLISSSTILQALIFINSNFDIIQALASKGGDPHFIYKIKDILYGLITEKINGTKGVVFLSRGLPEEYAKEILLSNTVTVINLWIKNGGKETPEQVTKIIGKATSLAPKDFLYTNTDPSS